MAGAEWLANITALSAAQPFSLQWWTPAADALGVEERDGWLGLVNANREWFPVHAPPALKQAARWVDAAFGASVPDAVAVCGAGRGDVIETLFERNPSARIIVIEPEAAMLRLFLSSRDWSRQLAARQLFVIGRGEWLMTKQVWDLAADGVPPLLVHPLLARRLPSVAARGRALYESTRWHSAGDSRRTDVKRSMLHHDVLLALEQAASSVQGAIVEIGAYVGGGTAAMGRGLRSTGHQAPFVSIEPGGRYLEHPDLPSEDIFADLTAFVESEGVADRVELINDRSDNPNVMQRVADLSAERGIGLLCIDADGKVDRDFRIYLPMCRAGALVAVDDYNAPGAIEKQAPTRAAVDAAVSAGLLQSMGVHGWGTWFGTVARALTPEEVAAAMPGVH
jgi:predicted O-methyltransferase YrrM